MDILLIRSIKRRVWIQHRKKGLFFLIWIIFFPNGAHCSMYMPISYPIRIENWFLCSEASKEEYIPFDLNQIPDGAHCSLLVHVIDPFDWSSRFSYFNEHCYKYCMKKLMMSTSQEILFEPKSTLQTSEFIRFFRLYW